MQRLSYISKPRSTPYRYETIVDVCSSLAAEFPEQEILIHHRINGDRFSIKFKDLELKSSLLGRYLYNGGASRKCPVSMYGPNSIEWVIGELAVLKTGAACVHLSLGTTTADDAMDILQFSNSRFVLVDPGIDREWEDVIQILHRKVKTWNDENPERRIGMIMLRGCPEFQSCECLDDILNLNLQTDLPRVYPEDPALVFSTSGSTGRPKLIASSHMSITNLVENLEVSIGLGYRVFSDRPFAWFGGSPFTHLVNGFTRIFTDSSVGINCNNMDFIWKVIRNENCNFALTAPQTITLLCDFLENCKDEDPFLLQFISLSGQIIDDSYKRALGKICRDFIFVGYGSTEMLLGCSKIVTSDIDIKSGDVGEPIVGVEIKIVDHEGKTVPLGDLGEVYARSGVQSLGYFNNPAKNKELFAPGGWIKSGDIGVIEEGGNLVIKGRKSDIISRGTRKILPAMVEEIVKRMPGLKEVVVISVPDKKLYEEICVCFVCDDDNINTTDVKSYCENHFLSEKTLDGIGEMPTYFVKIDTIPTLHTGKYDKARLREKAIDVLALS